jgi:hypothetical protein
VKITLKLVAMARELPFITHVLDFKNWKFKPSENGHFHLQDKYKFGIPIFSVEPVR